MSELARSRKLLSDYRQQKVSFAEQGLADKMAELEPLLEGAEAKMKLFEGAVQEWDWKMSRAKLKQSDFHQQLKEKEEKAKGKVQGFKVELKIEGLEELDTLLLRLTHELEVAEDFVWQEKLELRKGDALIKVGIFEHLRKSEFTKKFLGAYGREPAAPAEAEDEAEAKKEGEEEGKEEEPPFPLTLNFSRGFNRTIDIVRVADVLMKDVGDVRKQDGRWPLVIDPSGRTSTFVAYTGACVFQQFELKDMDPLRLRTALLKAMLYGSAIIIDLGNFDFPTEVVAEPWNNLEKGLFTKLVDRSAMYSYFLPRRFRSLITPEVAKDFCGGAFMDEMLQKFVLGFVTSYREPDLDFARQFYTISIKTPNEDEEAK